MIPPRMSRWWHREHESGWNRRFGADSNLMIKPSETLYFPPSFTKHAARSAPTDTWGAGNMLFSSCVARCQQLAVTSHPASPMNRDHCNAFGARMFRLSTGSSSSHQLVQPNFTTKRSKSRIFFRCMAISAKASSLANAPQRCICGLMKHPPYPQQAYILGSGRASGGAPPPTPPPRLQFTSCHIPTLVSGALDIPYAYPTAHHCAQSALILKHQDFTPSIMPVDAVLFCIG
jgi:hypothetical protein